MPSKLNISFSALKDADLLAKVGAIIASLTDNANFPEPWPAPTPSLEQVSAALTTFRDAYHAALDGAHSAISRRNHAREALTALLPHLASYLEWAAHGDGDKLLTTGFDPRHAAGRPTKPGADKSSNAAPSA